MSDTYGSRLGARCPFQAVGIAQTTTTVAGAARRGVRLDKRNFEGHRIPLSDDRRSLREPDRFDALPPRRTRSPSCKPVHIARGK